MSLASTSFGLHGPSLLGGCVCLTDSSHSLCCKSTTSQCMSAEPLAESPAPSVKIELTELPWGKTLTAACALSGEASEARRGQSTAATPTPVHQIIRTGTNSRTPDGMPQQQQNSQSGQPLHQATLSSLLHMWTLQPGRNIKICTAASCQILKLQTARISSTTHSMVDLALCHLSQDHISNPGLRV